MDEAREMTVEEARDAFMKHLVGIMRYWENEERAPTSKEKLEGMLFSTLVLFDGGSGFMPAFDITPAPHPDDKEFRRGEGENWWPEKVINDIQLHEMLKHYLKENAG